ncbi:MAG: M81 family metallopeptidase [Hyphomicrobiales bacterium]|nr:M81 family metallopeptidase [Hyphomicrobiales bacterium]
MRVAVGGVQHETNTFAPTKASLEDFEKPDSWPALLRGDELEKGVAGINLPVAGFYEAAPAHKFSTFPLLWCSASPSAHVREDAFEKICAMLLEDLAAVKDGIDAVYLDLHGAMVCEHLEDGDGEILKRVRNLVGDIPVVASLDLHANVTREMLEYADALLAYRTYPHIDMSETGARAARFLAEHCADGKRPAKAMTQLDFLVPLPWQCTDMEPARSLYAFATDNSETKTPHGEVYELSLAMGFPLSDIAECAPAVVAYGENQEAADFARDALVSKMHAAEKEFRGRLWSPKEALQYVADKKREGAGGPFVLADSQDNPGAGANSDTVGFLREMLAYQESGGGLRCAIGVVYDPQTAQEIVDALGEGGSGEMKLSLGAKTNAVAGELPLEESFQVVTCSASTDILATGPFYGGALLCMGANALLRCGEVFVVVGSSKIQCADRTLFTHYGLNLDDFDIVAVKSSVHFRADFDAIAKETLVVVSPGPAYVDLASLEYQKLRKGVRTMPAGEPL